MRTTAERTLSSYLWRFGYIFLYFYFTLVNIYLISYFFPFLTFEAPLARPICEVMPPPLPIDIYISSSLSYVIFLLIFPPKLILLRNSFWNCAFFVLLGYCWIKSTWELTLKYPTFAFLLLVPLVPLSFPLDFYLSLSFLPFLVKFPKEGEHPLLPPLPFSLRSLTLTIIGLRCFYLFAELEYDFYGLEKGDKWFAYIFYR